MTAPDRSLSVLYLVSRFPNVSETFVVRELNQVADTEGVEAGLGALFPPTNPFLHPAAARWVPVLRRPSTVEAAAAMLWWARRRPLRLLSSSLAVAAGYARRPRLMVRALATVPIAAAHARKLRERPVDHIHAHFASYPALAAWLCRQLTGIPYSFTAHAHDIFVQQCFLGRKIDDADFVATISQYNIDFLTGLGGRDTPLRLVHCGIDPSGYPFRPREIPASGPVRFACVASLQEYKGHRFLLEALAVRGAELDRIELDLIGAGKLQGELETLARRLGLADRVHLHGSLAEDEVARMLDRADAFVLPSIVAADGRQDGVPVALMEAIACGLPVVASRLSGIPELVREGESGVLARPGDAGDLAAALRRLVTGEAELDLAAGRRRIEAEYDVRQTGAELVELFRSSDRSA
jgi:colanic acid/amylovoran biosynthesis glycosyltransferase